MYNLERSKILTEEVSDVNSEHDHEYMHAHNIPHEHTHADGTTHSHEQPAGCGGDCASGKCGGCDFDPLVEVAAVMQYMVYHNASHISELTALGKRLEELGEKSACEQIAQSISDFEKGNMRLSAVLKSLNIPEK